MLHHDSPLPAGSPTAGPSHAPDDPAAAALVADLLTTRTFRGRWVGDRPVLDGDGDSVRPLTITRAGVRRAAGRDVPASVVAAVVRALGAHARAVQDELDVIALARAVDLGCAAADVAATAPAGAR